MSLELLMGIAGFLLILSVFANRISDNLEIPALLAFLAIGMLAGVDGLGRLQFRDPKMASNIGTVALTFILFAGGLDTKWGDVKPVLFRGTLLSTLGVFLTALFLYLCSYYIIGLPFGVALLLSVIVSSTDAPAVFSIMRAQKKDLDPKLRPILEFESGSNDPMAVILSMAAIGLLSSTDFSVSVALVDFLRQMVIGLILGLGGGKLAGYALSRWHLVYTGLYPVFGVGLVLIIFSVTQLIGGNGFLAVYLAGIILGNTIFIHRRQFIKFQESLSWIMQIGMFLLLGLLVNPKDLLSVMLVSIVCAVCLIFIARPLAVFACLIKSEFNVKEKIFISWAGFKGAVPIILATYPLMIDFPNSQFLFNLIFFLVIISVLLQGKTLPILAKWLNLYQK